MEPALEMKVSPAHEAFPLLYNCNDAPSLRVCSVCGSLKCSADEHIISILEKTWPGFGNVSWPSYQRSHIIYSHQHSFSNWHVPFLDNCICDNFIYLFLLYVYECLAFMHLSASHVCLVPVAVRRSQNHLNLCSGWLQAPMWVMETEPRAFGRASSDLNSGAISPDDLS